MKRLVATILVALAFAISASQLWWVDAINAQGRIEPQSRIGRLYTVSQPGPSQTIRPVIAALVSAVKELASRVGMLEALTNDKIRR